MWINVSSRIRVRPSLSALVKSFWILNSEKTVSVYDLNHLSEVSHGHLFLTKKEMYYMGQPR